MALTSEARKALRGVDAVDWSALSHPYGDAENVPQNLRDLLAAGGTDDALEAGTFFVAYFVCQQSHFGDAAPAAVPFLLRLLGARGVSRRGDIMTSLLSMLRIASDDAGYPAVESSLKQRVLAAFASESGAIVKAARVLDGKGFNDAVDALVVAFADTIAPLLPRMRAPKRVRAIVADSAAGGGRGPGDRLTGWAARRQTEPSELLLAIEEEIPQEWDPSEGEEADEGQEAESALPVIRDWEAHHREDCASTRMPAALEPDRQALTELYVAYRMRRPIDEVIELSGPVARLALQAPGMYRGNTMSSSVTLRLSLRDSQQPSNLPMDAWISPKGDQRWLALLVSNPQSLHSLCVSCEFLMGYIDK